MRRLASLTPFALLLAASHAPCQEAVPADQIDTLFARWNRPDTPGFAVGVIRDGRLIFAKGYGMANLEYGTPITPRSPFYIASMSKQFTAACGLLLARRGRLSLDDPVRKYIPELPDYGDTARPLKVRDLIHHTGGVREWSSLEPFAGHDDRFEHRLDNQDVMRMLLRQKNLEFPPGTRYRYSSGGYQLLREIIERVSGKSLRQFAAEEIFQPLGMTHTFFDDNYAAILPNRVESYRSLGERRYERLLKHFDVYGDGGLITTVEDLAKWDANFYSDQAGGAGFAALLQTPGRLDSGEPLRYAFGLDVYSQKGRRVVEHGGGMLGFTVDMARFPDQRLTVIALANVFEEWSTNMAFRVADLFLPRQEGQTPKAIPPAARPLTSQQAERYTGYYWSTESNFYRRIIRQDGTIALDSGEGTGAAKLIHVGDGQFVFESDPSRRAVLETVGTGGMRLVVGRPELGDGFAAIRYDPAPPRTIQDVEPNLGEYYSQELNATYRFWRDASGVFFQIGDGRPHQVFPKPDPGYVWNSKTMLWIRFGEITFRPGAGGRVTELSVGDQRVSGIVFQKIRSPGHGKDEAHGLDQPVPTRGVRLELLAALLR